MSNTILAAPDFTKRFIVEVGASDDGKGHTVFQLKDPLRADKFALDNRSVIMYYSKAFDDTMRRRPVYYREADALITSVEKGSYYSEASPYPLLIRTDHSPLQWIKSAAKGAVVGWRIERLGGVLYDIDYLPGPKNPIADALSRYPMIGPRRMARGGIENSLKLMFAALPQEQRKAKKIWFRAGADTTSLLPAVRRMRDGLGRISTRGPKEAFNDASWNVGVVAPRAEDATAVAARAAVDGRPICVLVPTDLVAYIAQKHDGTFDTQIQEAVSNSAKLQIMATLHTWLAFNTGIEANDVFVGEATGTPDIAVEWPELGTSAEWAGEQVASMDAEEPKYGTDVVHTRDSGLKLLRGADDHYRIYVPKKRRRALYEYHHVSLGHLSDKVVIKALRQSYDWPSLRTDVRKWYAECPTCETSKATRNASHRTWRAVQGGPPRARWGMDFYGIGDGHVLGLIDLDSRWVEGVYLPTREAAGVKMVIRDRILFQHGKPAELRSDHAREFVGRAVSQLGAECGYLHTSTGGYSATGNATIERFWRYLGRCLRLLTDEQYADVQSHLQSIIWAWNATVCESTGYSPFQVMTGTEPITVASAALQDESAATDLNVPSIIAAASGFALAAAAHSDYMRKQTSEVLNKHGRSLRKIKVGDHVKIFAPPGNAEAKRRMRKQKHIESWKGPMRVVARPSASKFVLEYVYDSKMRYERNISNVRRWVGPIPATPQETGKPVPVAGDIEVGDFLLVRDDSAAVVLYLVAVAAIADVTIRVNCWGTRGATPLNGAFSPVRIDTKGRTLLHAPTAREKAAPWSWEFDFEDIPDLVVLDKLKLTGGSKLSAASKKRISALAPKFKLHRF